MANENRRQDDVTIQVIAERMSALHEDVNDLRDTMKDSMREMAAAVTKLVVIEERQIHMNQSYDRLATALEKCHSEGAALEQRVDALEKEQPMTKQVVKWVIKGVWAIVAAAAVFAAKTLGIM